IKAKTSNNLVTNWSSVREKTGFLNIFGLVVLFSRWSFPWHCNGDANLVSGLQSRMWLNSRKELGVY
uniref:Ovule protein n=1 Tax=Mesocestoides corti TaxID=53468 RepID=A0A5K3G4M2_MESCO